jgi:hypothetical protein
LVVIIELHLTLITLLRLFIVVVINIVIIRYVISLVLHYSANRL